MATATNANGKRPGEQADQTPAKQLKSDYTSIVKVYAGKDMVPFSFHLDSIMARSDFFKAACSEQWCRSQVKIVNLPEQSPQPFKLYWESVYSPTVDLNALALIPAGVNDPTEHGKAYACSTLLKLWRLADFLGDKECKNQVILNLIRGRYAMSPLDHTNLFLEAYASRDGSALRKWMVDHLLSIWTTETIQLWWFKYPADMGRDLFKGAVARKGTFNRGLLKESDAAKYYE